MLQLLVTADVVPSPLIVFTLVMDAILRNVPRRHIPEDGILQFPVMVQKAVRTLAKCVTAKRKALTASCVGCLLLLKLFLALRFLSP
jgi:hypothetical protein